MGEPFGEFGGGALKKTCDLSLNIMLGLQHQGSAPKPAKGRGPFETSIEA